FWFCCSEESPVYPVLHSFPTRRSSDLDLVLLEGVHLCSAWLQHFGAPNAVLLDQSQINESALAELFDALVDDAPTYVLSPGLFKDRKSTRLNSSHVSISYAVFCLKKKR